MCLYRPDVHMLGANSRRVSSALRFFDNRKQPLCYEQVIDSAVGSL